MTFSAKNILKMLLASVLAAGAVSCGSQRQTATKSTSYNKNKPASNTNKNKPPLAHIDVKRAADNPVTESLLKEADSWIGTPYSWGGNDRNGVDCSGFVTQVYQRSLSIALPRNSAKQQEFCREIRREELAPGDLVFFTVRGGDRVGHVGIYIGNGNMVHSSSSKGVIITPLDNPYFQRNYYSSGRVERYYAMLDNPKSKGPSKPVSKQTAKPAKKANEISLETLLARTENGKKQVASDGDNLRTPLPSQVFASNKAEKKAETDKQEVKTNNQTAGEQEEEPDYDFFD